MRSRWPVARPRRSPTAPRLRRDRSAGRVGRMIEDYQGSSDARVIITDATGTAVVSTDGEPIAGWDYSTRPEIAAALAGDAGVGRAGSRRRSAPTSCTSPFRCSPATTSSARCASRTRLGDRAPGRRTDALAGPRRRHHRRDGGDRRPRRVRHGDPAVCARCARRTERFAGGDLTTRASTTTGHRRSATWRRRSTACPSAPSASSTASGRSPATPRTSCARR